jgi:hypothetical protein
MRRFLLKRLGSLASPFPKQPPIRHSPTPRRVHGARTRHPWRRHSSERQIAGVIVKSGYLATPRARSSTGNVSSGRSSNQAIYQIVTLVAKCISEPFKLNAPRFGSELDGRRISRSAEWQ